MAMCLDVLTGAGPRDLLCRVLGVGRVAAEPEAAGLAGRYRSRPLVVTLGSLAISA
jgi:hypothetical protein